MIIPAVAAVAALQGGWVWSLYGGADPVVLAEEVPDTTQLRTTMECDRGSGVVRVSLYGAADPNGETPGFVTIRSARAEATSQMETARDHVSFSLRTDHPVFAGLAVSGEASIEGLGATRAIAPGGEALPTLRRFAALCG